MRAANRDDGSTPSYVPLLLSKNALRAFLLYVPQMYYLNVPRRLSSFGEHAGNIQGTCKEHAGREYAGNMQGTCSTEGTYIQGTFREFSKPRGRFVTTIRSKGKSGKVCMAYMNRSQMSSTRGHTTVYTQLRIPIVSCFGYLQNLATSKIWLPPEFGYLPPESGNLQNLAISKIWPPPKKWFYPKAWGRTNFLEVAKFWR